MSSKLKTPFRVNVVLIETLYDTNIGATSRAMSNMAAERLILINRQCEVTYAAQQAAASGQNGLQNRIEYKNWDEFFSKEPDGIRIAFSARDGEGRPLKDFASTLQWIQKEHRLFSNDSNEAAKPIPIYLIFGREDHGLATQDIELAHFNVRIPTYGTNTSLNLAQAVLLALFILRDNWGVESAPQIAELAELSSQQDSQNQVSQDQTRANIFPEKTLQRWLEQMGFDLTKPVNAYTVIRRMILHNAPTQKELAMLETALQQSIRKQDKSTIKN